MNTHRDDCKGAASVYLLLECRTIPPPVGQRINETGTMGLILVFSANWVGRIFDFFEAKDLFEWANLVIFRFWKVSGG